jgi:uncharacterized membrane protein YesL
MEFPRRGYDKGQAGEESGVDTIPTPDTRPPAPIIRPLLPVGRTLRDWWNDLLVMSLASLATSALTLTVIGGPPSWAALYSMARAAILHDEPNTALYVSSLRAYFAKSWALAIVGLTGFAIWLLDFIFYTRLLGNTAMIGWIGQVFLLYFGTVWIQTILFGWALMVCRADLKLWQLLRNSLVLVLRYPTHAFISALFVGLLLLLAYFMPPLLVLVVPPLVAMLSLHYLFQIVPELVPDESEALQIVG